jgi:hypothetical protein
MITSSAVPGRTSVNHDVAQALIKSIPPALTVAVALLLGWFVGGRVTAAWELRRKRRELDLAAAEGFHKAYGEFFGIWKEWDAAVAGKFQNQSREIVRQTLFVRACIAEGRVEALVAGLAAQRSLATDEARLLGCYRRAYQTLRTSLLSDRVVGTASDGSKSTLSETDEWYGSDVESYVEFKRLAAWVGNLLARPGRTPRPDRAAEALLRITDDDLESPAWVGVAHELLKEHPYGPVRGTA